MKINKMVQVEQSQHLIKKNEEKYLCQLNLAKMRTNLDHPSMTDFVKAIEYINHLAERHKGFVWRLKDDETGGALNLNPFGDKILVNMSVWEDAQSLRDFVYKSHHKEYLKRKSEWFDKMDVYQVLWWIPQGHIPTLEEAKQKLELLKQSGPSPEAFGFSEALRIIQSRTTQTEVEANLV